MWHLEIRGLWFFGGSRSFDPMWLIERSQRDYDPAWHLPILYAVPRRRSPNNGPESDMCHGRAPQLANSPVGSAAARGIKASALMQ